jgi:hypothetical protein
VQAKSRHWGAPQTQASRKDEYSEPELKHCKRLNGCGFRELMIRAGNWQNILPKTVRAPS